MFLLGTGKQRAAKTSRVGVGATFLCFSSYSATLEGEDFVTVNFESYNVAAGQTYDEGILGKIMSKVSFGGDWDAGTNPYGTPPGLYPRDDLANVTLFASRLDGTDWAYPYLRVRTTTNSGDVGGKVTFSVGSAMNQGPFTFPTISV